MDVDVDVNVAPKAEDKEEEEDDEEDEEDDEEDEEEEEPFLLGAVAVAVIFEFEEACLLRFGGDEEYSGESGGGCEAGGLHPMNVPGKSLV